MTKRNAELEPSHALCWVLPTLFFRPDELIKHTRSNNWIQLALIFLSRLKMSSWVYFYGDVRFRTTDLNKWKLGVS